jgi:hypothetical protein
LSSANDESSGCRLWEQQWRGVGESQRNAVGCGHCSRRGVEMMQKGTAIRFVGKQRGGIIIEGGGD